MFALWYVISLVNGRYRELEDKECLQWLENAQHRVQNLRVAAPLKRFLPPKVFQRVMRRQTALGTTLREVIEMGLKNPDNAIGICAPESDAYFVFNELFNPFITEYHELSPRQRIPLPDLGDLNYFGNLDPSRKFVKSLCIQFRRNIYGYAFPAFLSQQGLLEVETSIREALSGLPESLKGRYISMKDLADQDLEEDLMGIAFTPKDPALLDAGVYRHWPMGRGIFITANRSLVAWVNVQDHLVVMCKEDGGNLRAVYLRFSRVLSVLETALPFAFDSQLGHMCFLPTNLGTAMRVKVRLCLPSLDFVTVREVCFARKLVPERVDSRENLYEICNKHTLGKTEFEYAQIVQDAISDLIRLEQIRLCL